MASSLMVILENKGPPGPAVPGILETIEIWQMHVHDVFKTNQALQHSVSRMYQKTNEGLPFGFPGA